MTNHRLTKTIAILALCGCLLGTRAWSAETNFIIQPAISTNLVGTTLMLSVLQLQDTNYPALAFRWFKDGALLSDTGKVTGSQTDTVLIEAAELENAGLYSVQVLLGSAQLAAPVSRVYLVEVPLVQGIRQENTGAGIRLVAEATGGLLSYQWTWQGQDMPGATARTLVFANAYTDANAGYYGVRVTNLVGEAVSAAPGFLLAKSAPSGTYEGLFYETAGVTYEASGFFQFTLTGSKRTFSGKLFMGQSRYSFSGKLSLTHEAATTILRKDGRALDLRFQLVTTNDDSRCYGTITDGVWDALFQGHLLYYTKANPTPLARNYTLALGNTNATATAPNGSGCARVVVSASGKVTLAGHTATGTSISQARGLSRSGTFPLYVVASHGRERILGWLKVTAQGSSSITGDNLVWTKAAGPEKLYSGGYSLALSAVGSPWPFGSAANLAFTDGIASFFAGDLFEEEVALGDFVRVRSKDGRAFNAKEAPERVQISIAKKTGLLKGSLRSPSTGKKMTIRGVAMPQQNRTRGYFLGPQASGNFTLVPTVGVP